MGRKTKGEVELDQGTVGWLIQLVLDRHHVSRSEFWDMYGERYGFSRSSWFRWCNNEVRASDIPLSVLQALAECADKPLADILDLLDIDANARLGKQALPDDVSRFHIAPFQSGIRNESAFTRSVLKAIKYRKVFMYQGIPLAFRFLEDAIKDAQDARASSLVSYLETYLADYYRISGQLKQSLDLAQRALDKGEELWHQGLRKHDDVMTNLGARIIANARIRMFTITYMASGVTQSSLDAGKKLLSDLSSLKVTQRLSGVYEQLARVALALGMHTQALDYVCNAEEKVFANTNPNYHQFELFLDSGGTLPSGKIDYQWSEDHIRSTKADILIALGKVEEAWEVYRLINRHKPPRTLLSPQNWRVPGWVNFVRQIDISSVPDDKLAYSSEDWIICLEESGDLRMLARYLIDDAEVYANQHDTATCLRQLERAKQIACQCDSIDLVIKSTAKRYLLTNAPIDLSDVILLQENLHRFDNPVIQELCRQALRATQRN